MGSVRGTARRAFTIVELLLVLSLITLTAAVSIWAYFSRPEITLENAALLLARDVRLAQNRSTLLRRPVSLVFHANGDGYRIVDGSEEASEPHLQLDRVERRYSRDAVFEGVSILRNGLAREGRLVFPGGSGKEPAGILTLDYRGESRAVELEAGTGRILLRGSSKSDHSTGL